MSLLTKCFGANSTTASRVKAQVEKAVIDNTLSDENKEKIVKGIAKLFMDAGKNYQHDNKDFQENLNQVKI